MKRTAAALLVSFSLLPGCSSGESAPTSTVSQPETDELSDPFADDQSDLKASQQCASGEKIDGRPVRVVTTIGPITNLAGLMAQGTRLEVTGLVPQGTNSHVFQSGKTAVDLIANADLIITNGLGLEATDVALQKEALSDSTVLCEAGEVALSTAAQIYTDSYPSDGGRPNPHGWMSTNVVARYLNAIRDSMSVLAPDTVSVLDENYVKLTNLVWSIEGAMKTALETVPARSRQMYMYHDAYPYMTRYFKMVYLGAAQRADLTEPDPTAVPGIVDSLKSKEPAVIFGSEEFDSPVFAAVASQLSLPAPVLLSDETFPGSPGEARHSWAGMIVENYTRIIEALGGDPAALKAVNVDIGIEDSAVYPAG
jgi:ABC-type Zn uptake system ZnuABC Zn-binding protein ZnuA